MYSAQRSMSGSENETGPESDKDRSKEKYPGSESIPNDPNNVVQSQTQSAIGQMPATLVSTINLASVSVCYVFFCVWFV